MLLSFILAKSEFLTNAAINEVTTSDERWEDYVILTMQCWHISRFSSRQDKALFSFLFAEKLTRDLIERINSIEEDVRRDHRSIENMLSNIANIQDRIEINKKSINEKCSKNKLNRVYKAVEKLQSSIDLIEDTNIIALEHLVKMIKGSARKETNSKMLEFE